MNFCCCGSTDEDLIDTSDQHVDQVDLKDPFAAADPFAANDISSPAEENGSHLDDFAPAATTTPAAPTPVATGDLIQF